MSRGRADIVNFGAGPSALPTSVLERVSGDLLNLNGQGLGIAELSHRSPEFIAIAQSAKDNFRKLLSIPSETHEVLLVQGGGLNQFSAVVLNLVSHYHINRETSTKPTMDYILTGSWSLKASQEAKRLQAGDVHIVVDARQHSVNAKFDNIRNVDQWQFSQDPAFVYYCDNETINGVEFKSPFPYHLLPSNALLVADISSNVLSRPIDISKHAIVFAGAQKNIAPAGLTFVVVRRDLLIDTDIAASKYSAPVVPHMLSYKLAADHDSMYNTPPCFAIYVAAVVLEQLLDEGGVNEQTIRNDEKAKLLYDCIDRYPQSYTALVHRDARSRMNVVFSMQDPALEKQFLVHAEAIGLLQLKGHRSVGGIRASLYNAITIAQTQRLVDFMQQYAQAS